ncbi:hypothetical protein CLHOM_17760 [Clostridium homopropionicum DSM 5847]|uniref:Uncharacterized protein n=1 Tax=Clostridium homopropionicum DSM 5847 TaxID=1121318 RepID=A0A0L6Z9P6_9CLOT|nr:DUF6143 family protein [Clostridium homopropionicum]KOA19687.1 hypothetical protein CLHOM_17760 [Clostridium homopropionicum DSM 5847]SFF80032.1 hypothetical protein SAMN04488501_102218 [Clostridium homopropionicum]
MSLVLMDNEKQPPKVNVLSENVYHSYLGEYFLGQTDIISFGGGYNAWGALVNPSDSKINMFLNAYTITNFSNVSLTAEGWLSTTLPGSGKTSPYFAAGNQAIIPTPMPKVKILNSSFVSSKPSGGTYTFVRRVEPSQTLTKHDFQGLYIIPPGSSFSLFFLSPVNSQIYARLAFGWWEESICQ